MIIAMGVHCTTIKELREATIINKFEQRLNIYLIS